MSKGFALRSLSEITGTGMKMLPLGRMLLKYIMAYRIVFIHYEQGRHPVFSTIGGLHPRSTACQGPHSTPTRGPLRSAPDVHWFGRTGRAKPLAHQPPADRSSFESDTVPVAGGIKSLKLAKSRPILRQNS